MRTSILIATSLLVVHALVVGCSSADGDPTSDALTTKKSPTERTPVGSATPVAASAVGAPEPPPPDSGADPGEEPPLPAPCDTDNDCRDACPPDAKGCACSSTPEGKLCIPTCTSDADCPAPPSPDMGPLVCAPEKVCIPGDP